MRKVDWRVFGVLLFMVPRRRSSSFTYEKWAMLEENLKALEVLAESVLRSIFDGAQERVYSGEE